MKRLLLLLTLLIAGITANAQFSPSNNLNYVKLLKDPPVATKNDSVVMFDGADKFLKMMPVSELVDNTAIYLELAKKQFLSTGLIKNGAISINADPTKYNLSAGIGIISNFDDPENPVSTIINFPAVTGKTPTYLTSGIITYIAVNSSGAIVEQASPFTTSQRRDLIVLGAVVHSNLTNINVVNNISSTTNASANQLHDLMNYIGALNLDGNKYSANGANLALNKSAGTIFKYGVNFVSDWKKPHELAQSAGTALTFRYRLSTGTEGSDRINIDPAIYESGGAFVAVPNNKFTIQTVTMFQTGLTRIQPGQNVYDSMIEAQNAIFTRAFSVESNIGQNGITRAYIIVKKETTSLQNVTDSKIIETQKYGGVASGGVALTLASIVDALGYTPENVANKATNFATINNTLYPSVQAVKNELDLKQNYGFTVYDKSYWGNLSDFSSTGVTPTIVNQGSVRLSGGSTDMSQYVIIPNYANSDENLDIEVLFIVNDINGRSPSIGKKSINSAGDLSGDLTASYDFSTNFIRCDQTAGNASASGFVVAVGDLCSMKVCQRGEDVTVTFTNINQDKVATNSFKFYTTNVSDLAIYNGFSSVDIKKIKVTSASNPAPNVLYIGDSKTQLPLGVNKGNRFPNYTSQFGVVDVFAGHGDKTAETLAGLPYILNHIKPKYVVLNQLRNDLANGVSSVIYQANYNSIVSQLNAIGATVVHLLPIPETVLDQSAITTFIAANFSNLINPSAFDPFTQTSDGFHPNDSGARFISNLIANSGYIPTTSILENKNLLKTDIDFAKTNKSNIFTLLQDFSTIKLPGTTAQYIRGDGTLATLPVYTIPVGANPTATVGASAVNGSASTFMRSDASPALNSTIDRSWSGIHTFTNTGVPNASIASASIQLSGGVGVTGQSYFGNGIRINGGHNIGSSIYSFGIFGTTTNPSTATTQEIAAASFSVNTFAGTYTTLNVSLLNMAGGITKGAGHTITYASGFRMPNVSQGVNNVNFGINANSLSGNWSIYNNSAYLNYLGTGNTLINTTTDNASGAKLQVSGNITATSYSGGATLTGTPTAPTATLGTNTNQIASTAFVLANAGGGGGSGDMILASAQTNTGVKTFLDGTLGLRNVANTFTSFFTNTNTASRTYTFLNKDYTVGDMLLGTAQTFTGTKTFAVATTNTPALSVTNALSGTSTSFGIYAENSNDGSAIKLLNSGTGYAINASNTGTGGGISATNNNASGSAIFSNNSSSNNGIYSYNSNVGRGIYSVNTVGGYGSFIANYTTGTGSYISNEGSGTAMRLENTTGATGTPFIYTKQGVNKFSVIDNGTANYGTDLSASYTDRSLTDKAYVVKKSINNTLTKTTNYTVLIADYVNNNTLVIYVDATAGNVTITLPNASTFTNYEVIVKKTDASANSVTITGDANIDGASTLVVSGQYAKSKVTSNGTQYFIL